MCAKMAGVSLIHHVPSPNLELDILSAIGTYVGDDLNAVVLPHSNAGVSGSEIDSRGREREARVNSSTRRRRRRGSCSVPDSFSGGGHCRCVVLVGEVVR